MADNQELAKKIQELMEQKDFMSKYGEKMRVPQGMDLGDIPDETARVGMKVPSDLKRGVLSKLAGRAGKALAPAAGIAGLLAQEELNPEGEIVEDPDVPMEIRAMAAKAGEQEMREEGAEEQEFTKKRLEKEARIQALMERLRQESGK